MKLLHHLLFDSAASAPERAALLHGSERLSYAELATLVSQAAAGLVDLGVERGERVAVYLPKQRESVAGMFAASAAGAVFVPVNPVLKPAQVGHILRDCGARVLITSGDRARSLDDELTACPELRHVVLVDGAPAGTASDRARLEWASLLRSDRSAHRMIDVDPVAILYTSGSTGKPKGVVLSHRNVVAGAASVAEYLENRESDCLAAVLPFSFDYGFSQLTTAFLSGASVALIDYLVPRDVLKAIERYSVTGLAAVPPLWIQLADLEWPEAATRSLRYITNSGGAMPRGVLNKLRHRLPNTSVYLMYGLTEAFRSTYLHPSQVDLRPDSIGKAIPNAEILVVRPDGTECDADEPGELVHRGAHVSLGYWNDPERTAQRFRPVASAPGLPLAEVAVWSGDTVVRDDEGYLYFVGRRDEMIKTSGYRVSPTEIEEVVYASGQAAEVVAVGVPHAVLGSAIAVVVVPAEGAAASTEELLAFCRKALPSYMVPVHVAWQGSLPRNSNGKLDRPVIAAQCLTLFGAADAR